VVDARLNFTIKELKALPCPETRTRYQDTQVRGLVIRLQPSGSKTFYYYRRLQKDNESPNKVVDIFLGDISDITIEQARTRATEFNAVVGHLKDPSKPSTELTYGKLFQQYLDSYAKLQTSTWESAIYNHGKYFQRWHNKPIEQIKRVAVQAWVNDLAKEHGVHTANRNYNTMRAVFSWGLRKDVFAGENPCLGVDNFKTQARERFIQPGSEYIEFAKALNQEPNETIRDFFWICLFTGSRRAKVLEMEWSQIDFDLMVWRIGKTKNGDSLTLPLTPNAIEILQRRFTSSSKHERWVFPSDRKGRKTKVLGHLVSPGKAWERIIKRAKIKDLRIHDLRRTAGSYMAIQGVSPTIIGKALGHRSPQSTAIYARLTQDPVRKALENAQAALGQPAKLLPVKSNVIKIGNGYEP